MIQALLRNLQSQTSAICLVLKSYFTIFAIYIMSLFKIPSF